MKKISVFCLIFVMILALTGCATEVNVTSEEDSFKIEMILDNNEIKADESDIEIFKLNNFEAALVDEELHVYTYINKYYFDEEFKERVSFLKQILITINPSLENIVSAIDVYSESDIFGYSFAGTQTLKFISSGIDESVKIPINFNLAYNTNLLNQSFPSNTDFSLEYTGDDFEIDLLNIDNIEYVGVETAVDNEITSTVQIQFKEKINVKDAETSLGRSRITDFKVSEKQIEMTFEYTSPKMFNSLHAADLFNIYGGIYKFELKDSDSITKNGKFDVKVVDNNIDGIVEYSLLINDGDERAFFELSNNNSYDFEYNLLNTSKLFIIIGAFGSMALVIGGFVFLFKKR